jgi:hypothetical protein
MKRLGLGLLALAAIFAACGLFVWAFGRPRLGPGVMNPPPKRKESVQTVTFDLSQAPAGGATTVGIPPFSMFEVRLAGRAPAMEYSLRIQEDNGSGIAPPPRTQKLDPWRRSFYLTPLSPDCYRQQFVARSLHTARDEATAALAAKRLSETLSQHPCPGLETAMGWVIASSETFVFMNRMEARGRTELTLERSPGLAWRLVLEPRVSTADLPFAGEEEWLVGAVTRTLAELALLAAGRTSEAHVAREAVKVQREGPPEEGRFHVRVGVGSGLEVEQRLTLDPHVLSPSAFAPLAATLLGRMAVSTTRPPTSRNDSRLLRALLDPRSRTLAREGTLLSRRLGNAAADSGVHEDVALALGALGLREAAGAYADLRTVAARMAAHLAIAQCLRAGAPPKQTGEIGEIVLATLLGRQTEALERLERMGAGRSTEAAAWRRALVLRNTADWRPSGSSSRASLLERLEQFRAAVVSLGSDQALGAPRADAVPDWSRIALQSDFSVAVGNEFAEAALRRELADISEAWKGLGMAVPENASALAALAERDDETVERDDGGSIVVRTIGPVTWARYFARHIAQAVSRREHHLRAMLGLTDNAQAFRGEVGGVFAGLPLLDVVRVTWQNRAGRLADGQDPCPASIRLVREHPDLVPAEGWAMIEATCARTNPGLALPPAIQWFALPSMRGLALDLQQRIALKGGSPALTPEQLRTLLAIAPRDQLLIALALGAERQGAGRNTPEQMQRLYGPLLQYDLSAMRSLASLFEENVEEYVRRYEAIVAIVPDEYMALGAYLAEHHRPAEAAAAYENAIRRAKDRIRVSNSMGWLVDNYFDGGKPADALRVASMASGTGSAGGIETLARLLERRGLYRDAETRYRSLGERYGEWGPVHRFYVRYEQRVGDGRYRIEALAATQRLFPRGLQRVTVAELSGPPGNKGVAVGGDWPRAWRELGTRPPDVIVAVDGYRVESKEQLECVASFSDDPRLSVVVWRDGKYEEITGPFSRWGFGPARTTTARPA